MQGDDVKSDPPPTTTPSNRFVNAPTSHRSTRSDITLSDLTLVVISLHSNRSDITLSDLTLGEKMVGGG
ncbi:hypothetical protein A2U01_0098328, partial [Trifolium medium]|nr:hypothetical protein [Trifolium medium]